MMLDLTTTYKVRQITGINVVFGLKSSYLGPNNLTSEQLDVVSRYIMCWS